MDRDLLTRALRPLLPELTSFARWLVGSKQEADELVHEVVVRALERASTIEDPSRLRAWLFRTARNARIDLLRAGLARSRLMVLDGGIEETADVAIPDDALPAVLDRLDIERALARLPEQARATVLLADLWEFPYEEVATILDVPTGTVRSRLARARARLAQLLAHDAARSAAEGSSE